MRGTQLIVSLFLLGLLLYGTVFGIPHPPGMRGAQPVVFELLFSLLVYAILSALPRWSRSLRLHQLAAFRQRIPELASRLTSRRQLLKTLAALSNEELLWALHLSDYGKARKDLIAAELSDRGVPPAAVAAWLPAQTSLTLPPSLGACVADSRYVNLTRWRSRLLTSYQIILLVFFLSLVLTGVLAIEYLSDGSAPPPSAVPAQADHAPLSDLFPGTPLGASLDADTDILRTMVLVLLSGAILLRNCNRRVLLLRPFGEKRMTEPLRRLVARSLGRLGHVYTLSDDAYRSIPLLSLIDRLPLVFPQFLIVFLGLKALLNPLFSLRHSFRIAVVTNDRQFRRLGDFLLSTFGPSLIGLFSWGQAFNVRCSATWWRTTVLCLMYSSDVIVVDVSTVKEGTGWEIRQLRERGLLQRTLFLVGEPYAGNVHDRLSRLLPAQEMPAVFRYSAKGVFRDGPEVLSRLVQLSGPQANRQHNGPAAYDAWRHRSGVLWTGAFSLAALVPDLLAFTGLIVVVVALVFGPRIWPYIMATALISLGAHLLARRLRRLAYMPRLNGPDGTQANRRHGSPAPDDTRRDRSGVLWWTGALYIAALVPDVLAFTGLVVVVFAIVHGPRIWPYIVVSALICLGAHLLARRLRRLAYMQRINRPDVDLQQR